MRSTLTQMLSLGYSIASMLMLYTGLGLAANTSSPIVVVLSGSMEPGIRRGDLILLTNPSPAQYSTGDIVVYELPSQDVPIVHRIIQSFNVVDSVTDLHDASILSTSRSQDQLMLTKGDNNPVDDLMLYDGLEHIQPKHVVGKMQG
ncbi:hypothetical protein D9619_013428 [Psilocybe cf. subviscida]|uniref:Signal peptidase complex catalytic subunit SEC11 n=1 Tax=Psilocybe cf. subviscida TaxID=2480587 RepID=A0A8H5BTT2_9AGAR|nr:hypothetical protein D9619_013428 [Psilocybe cf. subviscida]